MRLRILLAIELLTDPPVASRSPFVFPRASAEATDAKDSAEFMRLSNLPKNNRKSDDEIWAMVQF